MVGIEKLSRAYTTNNNKNQRYQQITRPIHFTRLTEHFAHEKLTRGDPLGWFSQTPNVGAHRNVLGMNSTIDKKRCSMRMYILSDRYHGAL